MFGETLKVTVCLVIGMALVMSILNAWAKILSRKNLSLFYEEGDWERRLISWGYKNERTLLRVGLANWLGFFRFAVGLAVGTIYIWQLYGSLSNLVALVLLLIGFSTDLFDGLIARTRRETTPFGRMMDPIADKSIQYLPALGMLIHMVSTEIPSELTGPLVQFCLGAIVLRDILLFIIFIVTRVNQKPSFVSKARAALLGVIGIALAFSLAKVAIPYADIYFVVATICTCAILSIASFGIEATRMIRTKLHGPA